MPIPPKVAKLVEQFDRNKDEYRAPTFKEATVRVDFINPMFRALGWDMENEHGHAEAYRDVIHEASLKIGEGSKAPDYCFRIGGTPKFYLEAKKPSVNIKDDPEPAYQLRRYAWNPPQMSLSILTDFEEFAVYDGRVMPKQSDKASVARVDYFRYTDYHERWDEIEGRFSKQAILQGSFDRYADNNKKKRGTATVDSAFLKEIESWREMLAKNFAKRNPKLTSRELNYAVQITIDRIIFLRMCEDRGIEPYGTLRDLTDVPNIYGGMFSLFRQADDRYNSGLFHFADEKGRPEGHDELTPKLALDDAVIKPLLRGLYYPQSPYVFSKIPPEILGHVYEQFLGKVIRLTAGHQAKVEEKPEVRKAGGVYYTPTYIVDYIVKHTVGKLLEGKTPKEAGKLRVLDPACGSGSFLLGAFQYLMDWHLDHYRNHAPEKSEKEVFKDTLGAWHLTTAEKKRILKNNIFGVDIDAQAVEVTKLSLLLKVLEGETKETINSQRSLFHGERVLPDLAGNIKCGNSLIGPDFYDEPAQGDLFEDEEQRLRINVFDWKASFPAIMKAGGFDAVIGNPPYVLLQVLEQPTLFSHLSRRYQAAKYKIDTYHVFLEKALELTKQGCHVGFITPNSFLRNKHALELRRLLLGTSEVDSLRIFYYPVFRGASVDTSIVVLRKVKTPSSSHIVSITRSKQFDDPGAISTQSQAVWDSHPEKHFTLPGTAGSQELLTRINGLSLQLGAFATAYFGIQTFDRTRFVLASSTRPHHKRCIDGGNISRYALSPSTEFVDFRPEAIKSGGKEYVYEQARIGVRQIGAYPIATLLPAGIYSLNTIYNIFFTKPTSYSLKFVLAVICSRALRWYWGLSFFDHKETFPKIKKDALLAIPLPLIDFSDPRRHDRVVVLVDRMLALHELLSKAITPPERTSIQSQITATDRQIDSLIYELFGLTEVEIQLVERDTGDDSHPSADVTPFRTSLADWAEEHGEHWGDELRSDDVEGFTGRRF